MKTKPKVYYEVEFKFPENGNMQSGKKVFDDDSLNYPARRNSAISFAKELFSKKQKSNQSKKFFIRFSFSFFNGLDSDWDNGQRIEFQRWDNFEIFSIDGDDVKVHNSNWLIESQQLKKHYGFLTTGIIKVRGENSSVYFVLDAGITEIINISYEVYDKD